VLDPDKGVGTALEESIAEEEGVALTAEGSLFFVGVDGPVEDPNRNAVLGYPTRAG